MKAKRKHIAGIATLVIGILTTGCATVKTNLAEHHNDTLYVAEDYNNEHFSYITNNINNSGFELDTYKPVNMLSKGDVGLRGIVINTLPSVPYYYYECQNGAGRIIALNIVGIIPTLGLNLLVGGICKKDMVFDPEEFDESAKLWISENNIDSESILSQYDGLLKDRRENEALYNTALNDINNRYAFLLSRYSQEYKNRPEIIEIYTDKSGLYDGTKELATITMTEKGLPEKHIQADADFETPVNNAFPCHTTQKCLANIETAKHSIKDMTTAKLKKLEEITSTDIPQYEQSLQKASEYLIVSVNTSNHKKINHKILNYRVNAPARIATDSKTMNIEYEILSVDYENVFPPYDHANKDVKFMFNQYNKTITVENLTNEYLQIDSINMYYGKSIYEIVNNRKANFASELPPKSSKTYRIIEDGERIHDDGYINIHLYGNISQANYKNLTKEIAKKSNIDFGFAMKYALGNRTKNKTLFAMNKFNLYREIENK